MKKVVWFALCLLPFILAFSLNKLVCSQCGSLTVPAKCEGFAVHNVSCSVSTFAFTCAREKRVTGLLFCPSCPSGYHRVRCESEWFGLIKHAVCEKRITRACGEGCLSGEKVVDFKPCITKKEKVCCTIPQNNVSISIVSSQPAFVNQPVLIEVIYQGVVRKVVLELGDGRERVLFTNKSFGMEVFNVSYSQPGYYEPKVMAISCTMCPKAVVSSASTHVLVK